MKCPKCKGIKTPHVFLTPPNCNFCNDKEDLDWVEMIIGVDEIILSSLHGGSKGSYIDFRKKYDMSKM